MPKPANFLENYDVILFDLDGVITSEQRYWDSAALSVYEYLNPDTDAEYAMTSLADIRRNIFCDDKTVTYLKERGVNSNWDTAYLTLAAALALNEQNDFPRVYDYLTGLDMNALEMYNYFSDKSALGERSGKGYTEHCVLNFQEWYLGDDEFEANWHTPSKRKGKPGMYKNETPIVPIDKLHGTLSALTAVGKSLGIGTGRVEFETRFPLDGWSIRQYFDHNRIVTYTNVMEGEKANPGVTLTKPNPYMFLKGMLGIEFPDAAIINGEYDGSPSHRTLVIGDAGADIAAAHAGGMDFAAVLTGISGERAAEYFKAQGAEYILPNVCALAE